MSKKKGIKDEELMDEVVETEVVDATEAVETAEAEVEVIEEPTVVELYIAKDEEVKAAAERHQRTMAEFDNFRKRTIKEKGQMYENGAKEVLEKLLPAIDNFATGN